MSYLFAAIKNRNVLTFIFFPFATEDVHKTRRKRDLSPIFKTGRKRDNWRNREENETNDQKYHALPESRCREENTKKPGSKPVLVPGFSTKNSASGSSAPCGH
jgi:hypothetical protein